MNKIWLIIQREYWVRVRKKSFIIMTFLTPILFAALMIIPAIVARSSLFQEEKVIQVLDKTNFFAQKLKETSKIKFTYLQGEINEVRKKFEQDENTYALLIIPEMTLADPKGFRIVSKKSISLETEIYIKDELERIIREERMRALGIKQEDLEKTKARVSILTETQEGKESSSGVIYAVSFIAAILIYMSVLLYGVQVMRSVIEEKTNRIVEVMVSSVKPIQLMLGKIIGVAGVGLTQFLLWIVLSFALSSVASSIFLKKEVSQDTLQKVQKVATNDFEKTEKAEEKVPFEKISNAFATLNLPLILACFLFYFVGGYLLYSALFAAIGSAGDNETDAQQFTLPVTLPLIIAFVLAQGIINEPNSGLAFWLSMIPFTSPIVMMVRIPAGVPNWEIILSMVLLVIGFLAITWLAARIYRIGILMYGKKVNFKELGKWLIMKN
ncbi:MAG: ABC transporter permease [Raineya sp.]|nr:ABC transporter permease [Raineya sp.]MDW8295974.1 ABC transporter permease [Raineya sp.]